MLARYGHLEDIPDSAGQWDVPGLRGAAKLSLALRADYDLALLFRRIATVELDVEVGTVDDWAWTGPTPEFAEWATRLGEPRLAERAASLARARSRGLTRQRFVSSAGTSGDAIVWAPLGSPVRLQRARRRSCTTPSTASPWRSRRRARARSRPLAAASAGDVQQRDEVVGRRVRRAS